MALTGLNGNNETKIGFSNTMSLTVYDNQLNEIRIKNLREPIEIYIPNDPVIVNPLLQFQYVNVENKSRPVIVNSLVNNLKDVAITIDLKPFDDQISYLVIVKLGYYLPSFQNHDFFFVLCSNKNLVYKNNQRVYSLFLSKLQLSNHQGKILYAITELNEKGFMHYCSNETTALSPFSFSSEFTSANFSDNFEIIAYSSGCYYMDRQSGKWKADGLNVTNLVVLPSEIDFDYVFANASIQKNLTIYVFCLSLSFLFAISSGLALYIDKRDSKKVGITLINLESLNTIECLYFYEVIVFTSSQTKAQLGSVVYISLYGDREEREEIRLANEKRRCFRKGGIDSFIIPFERPLGKINYIKIKYEADEEEQSEKTNNWFMEFVIVNDLQTSERFFFSCNQSLSIDNQDGHLIDRFISMTLNISKSGLYIKREHDQLTKWQSSVSSSLSSNDELWKMLNNRPVQNLFYRIDQVMCVFVFLYTTMLFNALYYNIAMNGTYKYSKSIELGPFLISSEQVRLKI